MEPHAATTEALRTWQEVRKERGIPLDVLGELIGAKHSTLRAYSAGYRPIPQELLWKLSRLFGEPVR